MSQRGSRSSKFIGGKSWSGSSKGGSSISKVIDKAKKKSLVNASGKAFNTIISFLPKAEAHSIYYDECKALFTLKFSRPEQQIALKNIKHYIEFCESNNVDSSINHYLIDLFCFKDYHGAFILASIIVEDFQTTKQLISLEMDLRKRKMDEDSKNELLACIKFLYKKVNTQ